MKPCLQRLLFAILACFYLTPAQAAEPPKAVPEFTMKAVYLYNFAQLTEWPSPPAGSADAFKLCVYGEGELASALMGLQGRMVNRQQLRFLRVADVAEARQCQLLYVGEDEVERGGRLVEALRGAPVLIVTDAPRVARAGAMLLILSDGRRLSFEANVDFAKRSQLKFSSRLLGLAKRVSGE